MRIVKFGVERIIERFFSEEWPVIWAFDDF